MIEISVPREKLEARLTGRCSCPNCGATYHMEFSPPQNDRVCDRCGFGLTQRADDTFDAIKRRLDIYFEQTEPLLAYYESRGLLSRVSRHLPGLTREQCQTQSGVVKVMMNADVLTYLLGDAWTVGPRLTASPRLKA